MDEVDELTRKLDSVVSTYKNRLRTQNTYLVNLRKEYDSNKKEMIRLEKRSAKLNSVLNYSTFNKQLEDKAKEYETLNTMLRSEIETNMIAFKNCEKNYKDEENLWAEEITVLNANINSLTQKKEKIVDDIKNWERTYRERLENLKREVENLKRENIDLERKFTKMIRNFNEVINKD